MAAVHDPVSDLTSLDEADEVLAPQPAGPDEFVCGDCLQIHPRSRFAGTKLGSEICEDCI